jgi:hypothetical protein
MRPVDRCEDESSEERCQPPFPRFQLFSFRVGLGHLHALVRARLGFGASFPIIFSQHIRIPAAMMFRPTRAAG